MKQITEDYVSEEVAKLLQMKGFDEPCDSYYEWFESRVTLYKGYMPEFYHGRYKPVSDMLHLKRPTHQMALKWLREVHEFIVTIDYDRYPVDNGESSIVGYGYNIQTKDNPEDYYRISESVYESYEEAVEAALKFTLENLI